MEELCRICVTKSNEFNCLFSISQYGITFAEMIFTCTQIEMQENIETYTNICQGCISKLNIAYEFHNLCESSEVKLKQYIPRKTSVCGDNDVDEEELKSEMTIEEISIPLIKCENFVAYESDSKPTDDEDVVEDEFKQSKSKKPTPKRQKPTKKFQCYKCKVFLNSHWRTIHHLREHDAAAKHKCSVCSEQFMKTNDFNKHICSGNRLQCEYCQENFDATIKLVKHLDENHAEKRFYRCPKCAHFFAVAILLEHHVSTHPLCSRKENEIIKEFVCDICSKPFPKYTLLQQHLFIHSESRRKFFEIENQIH